MIGITAAMAGGTGLSLLARELPDHYYDVGIAEQHAVLFAAGLALEGMKPVCAIYSTFLQRAYDQIIHDVCLQKLDVVFAMDRAGLVGDDGPTHHGSYDISYLRAIPNMVVMAPRDEAMLVHMLRTAIAHDGPVGAALPARRGARRAAARAARGDPDRHRGDARPRASGWRWSATGAACRSRSTRPRRCASAGVDPTVCDARFAKPLDRELLHSLAASHELLVTIEENVLAGGFGSAVLEHLSDSGTLAAGPAVIRFGLPDRYVTHGKPALLHEEVGLTAERVAERVLGALDRRGRVAERLARAASRCSVLAAVLCIAAAVRSASCCRRSRATQRNGSLHGGGSVAFGLAASRWGLASRRSSAPVARMLCVAVSAIGMRSCSRVWSADQSSRRTPGCGRLFPSIRPGCAWTKSLLAEVRACTASWSRDSARSRSWRLVARLSFVIESSNRSATNLHPLAGASR